MPYQAFSTITKNRNPQIDTAHIQSWKAKHNTCCVSTQLPSKFTALQRNTPQYNSATNLGSVHNVHHQSDSLRKLRLRKRLHP